MNDEEKMQFSRDIYEASVEAIMRNAPPEPEPKHPLNKALDAIKNLAQPEPSYACARCGATMTEAQGGNVFMVCDDCWDEQLTTEPSAEAVAIVREQFVGYCGVDYEPDEHETSLALAIEAYAARRVREETWALATMCSTYKTCLEQFESDIMRHLGKEKRRGWDVRAEVGETVGQLRQAVREAVAHERKALEPLTALALDILDTWHEHEGVDDEDIWDSAVRHGALVPTRVTEPCSSEDCRCAETGFPMDCYREPEALAAVRARRAGGKP